VGLPASVASWSLAIIGLANIEEVSPPAGCSAAIAARTCCFGYGSRTMLILFYLFAPKIEWTFYLLAVGLGFPGWAHGRRRRPESSASVGTRYLATLYGLTIGGVSHRSVGAFFGACWGLALANLANYLWMWYRDACLP